MGWISVILAILVSAAIASGIPRVRSRELRIGMAASIVVVMALGLLFSSVRYVGENSAGVVIKNALGPALPPGKIIATTGEMGPQAKILPPGWHVGYWPGLYDIESTPVLTITQGEVGLLTALDGRPLPAGQPYAPEWAEAEFDQMLNAEHFLGDGGGHKGPQASVLPPGNYRLNPRLFKVEKAEATNVPKATVGVVKSNIGGTAAESASASRLVERGERGIWRQPYTPGEYYINPKAYEVTMISTRESMVEFTKEQQTGMERAITVRTSDGFEFPVDVRVVYKIEPGDAPKVVATLRDDQEGMLEVLQSAVRAIFRNNAQDVKALDYVQQRAQQEISSTNMLSEAMTPYGVTISAVRINDVGDDSERWQSLLKTQTDREIALQEQETFREQQRAAEQKKELTRTEQEAEEERRLATARYEVQIAEQEQQRKIIQAKAEAEAIQIKATAQAEAYRLIAVELGKGNTALVEVLKIVGETGVNITPRVMVHQGAPAGGSGALAASDGESAALIGTMLDMMLQRQEASADADPAPLPGARTDAR